jgi:hypothetical protein
VLHINALSYIIKKVKEVILMGLFKKRLMAAALLACYFLAASPLKGLASGAEWQNQEFIQSEPIISVSLPLNLNFTIDPFEVDGRGQVYSETYFVRNFGATSVLFDIVTVGVSFRNYWEHESVPYPFDDSRRTDLKSIYLSLDFDRYNMPSVVLTDPYYPKQSSAVLEAHSAYNEEVSQLSFRFSGNVNAVPASAWSRGDVMVTMVYSITPQYPEGYGQPTPEPTPHIPPEQPTPEPTLHIPPEQPTPEPTPHIPPEQPTPEPTPYVPPEQPTPEPTPYIPLEQSPGTADDSGSAETEPIGSSDGSIK